MKICVTGHKPDKLYGYNIYTLPWLNLKNKFKKILKEENCTEAVTGMALGVDMVFAQAVLELKDAGYRIRLFCALPCIEQETKWNGENKNLYHSILRRADETVTVCKMEYKPWVLQKRNEYMIARTDMLIAVWDGSAGNTKTCIRYAEKMNKQVRYIDPADMMTKPVKRILRDIC